MIALYLQWKGRPWGTEVKVGDRGRVDVLDWGPPEGKAVAYEIETDCSPKEEWEKINQYQNWIVRDVIVLDPTEAPDRIGELWDWLRERILG